MLLTQYTFYRNYGVRVLPQVAMPMMHDLKFLELPKESVYHYLTFDSLTDGPANDDPKLRNVKRIIPLLSPLQLTAVDGHPRRMGGDGSAYVRDYLKTHRRMRRIFSPEQGLKDRDTPIVVNYAFLPRLYRYLPTPFSNYYRWRNLFATFLDEFNNVAATSNWNHYVVVHVPKVLPTVRQLIDASTHFNQKNIRTLREPSAFMLLELWKWFTAKEGEQSENPSIFNRVAKEKVHLLNFIFEEGGKWCVVNFGMLNSFFLKEGQKEPDPAFVLQAKQHVTGLQMAKRVLRMYMSIMESRNLALKQLLEQERKALASRKQEEAEQKTLDNPPEVLTEEDTQRGQDKVADTQQQTQDEKLSDEMLSYLGSISIIDEEEFANLNHDDFRRLISEQDAEIDADLLQLEKLSEKFAKESPHESLEQIVKTDATPPAEQGVIDICERLAINGAISAGEYRKYQKAALSYKELKAPLGQGTLEEFMTITPEALKITESEGIPDSDTVIDKTMLKSSLNLFDAKYVKEVLHKDIANTVMSVQKAGVAVTGYRIDKVEDILGGYEDHVVRLSPVVGQPSTIRFKVPVIREDGTYITNGVKYRLRKQRGDLPIRKTAPNIVALTSYYGKCFITRGRRNSDSYGYWLQTTALAKALDPNDPHLTDAITDNAFDSELTAPRSYTAISNTLAAVTVGGRYRIRFDHKNALQTEAPKARAKDGTLYLGQDLTTEDTLWLSVGGVSGQGGRVKLLKDGTKEDLGTLEEFMGIGIGSAPVEYTTARVYGKDIPVGVILGLEMGMERLMGALRVTPRIVPAGEKASLTADEWGLTFADETWVFNRQDQLASLILSGFNEYDKSLRLFSAHSFDQRGVYINLLETNGIGVRYVRELDLMTAMFVDSITRDILIEMGEPTTFKGLLLRANQMLMNDAHPDELDPAFMRIKGYERISGAIYSELINSLRQHNAALGRASLGVQMNPYAVWKRISEDPAKLQISEINPLATLKDAEAVTYLGEGGRGRLSMTKGTRGYHTNDMGTISEATVDNSDVSINIHTSADPQFTSLRGMSKRFDLEHPNPTALLSTSALLAPASDRDDPKRVNFVSIQQKHAIACEGYHQPMVRTGYETVLAHRTGDLYAYTAKKAGVVRAIVDKGIIVDYEDGQSEGYELGRRFGNAQGLTVAHDIVTPLKEGDKVAIGDVIVYNTGFFEPDFFNPRQVVWKNSLNARTVLWESTQTHEDSSSISRQISDKLTTHITKVKIIVIAFDQAISHLVKQNDAVISDSVLCIIQDAVTANSKLFNEQSIETLKTLSAQTPRAHVQGVVEKVEVFYHGDKEDMSESVRELCDWGDAQLRKQAQALGQKPNTGAVDGGFRIENNPLGLDNIAIKIYITSDVAAGVGDKGVFGNQLKTCFGEVMESPMTTEDGQIIDAVFGYRSLEARIVESPIIIGTTASLLQVIGEQAVAIYEGTSQ
jgi:hypothetical protein